MIWTIFPYLHMGKPDPRGCEVQGVREHITCERLVKGNKRHSRSAGGFRQKGLVTPWENPLSLICVDICLQFPWTSLGVGYKPTLQPPGVKPPFCPSILIPELPVIPNISQPRQVCMKPPWPSIYFSRVWNPSIPTGGAWWYGYHIIKQGPKKAWEKGVRKGEESVKQGF